MSEYGCPRCRRPLLLESDYRMFFRCMYCGQEWSRLELELWEHLGEHPDMPPTVLHVTRIRRLLSGEEDEDLVELVSELGVSE